MSFIYCLPNVSSAEQPTLTYCGSKTLLSIAAKWAAHVRYGSIAPIWKRANNVRYSSNRDQIAASRQVT
jgi:hypothetical protein